MAESEDRTEAPSPQRQQKARDEGQIAFSREAMNIACLMGGTIGVFVIVPITLPRFVQTMAVMMQNAGAISQAHPDPSHFLVSSLMSGLPLVIGPALAVLVLTLATGLLQTGFLLNPSGLSPKLSRLSWASGFKRICGWETLLEVLKTVAKLVVFALVMIHEIYKIIPSLRDMTGLKTGHILHVFAQVGLNSAISLVLVQLVIAGIDVFWTRFRHMSKLKMSREELKEEYKNTEGDPHVKGRLKMLRARAAKQRMKEAVEKATVVITNPTHYAVALHYDQNSSQAPKIVAKGMDEVAARIREIAQDNRIPIVPNPPLARTLHTLPLDSEIPAEHFRAVAAIISYVWRLKKPAYSGQPVR